MMISAAPYQYQSLNSEKITWGMVFAMIPSILWSVFRFGLPVLILLTIAVVAALSCYIIISRVRKAPARQWSQSVLVACMITFFLPVHSPWYVPFFASIVAVLVGIVLWGGVGRAWFNPAAIGLAFILLSWSDIYLSMGSSGTGIHRAWFDFIRQNGLPGMQPSEIVPNFYTPQLTLALDSIQQFLRSMHLSVPYPILGMILGLDGILIGASSVPFILLGSVFVLASRNNDWRIPAIVWLITAIIVFLFGGLGTGQGFGRGDMVFFLLDGGLLTTLLFFPCYPSTLPHTVMARMVYALVLGILFGIVAIFGRHELAYPVAFLFASIHMPLFDQIARKKHNSSEASV